MTIAAFNGISDDEVALAVVKLNGEALQFVINQTEEICLAAVNEHYTRLEFVKDKAMFIKIAKELNIEIEI